MRRVERSWSWRALLLVVAVSGLCGCPCEQAPAPGGADAGDADGSPRPAARTHVPEVEPNDSPAKASPFEAEASAPGSPILKPLKGVLASADDVDWIVIPERDEAGSRQVTLRPEGSGDVALVFEAGEGVLDLGGEGVAEVVPNLSPGEVRVGVKAGRSAGVFPIPFTLELRANLSKNAVEVEPAGSTSVVLPGDVQGIVNHSADRDVFVLDTSALADAAGLTVEVRGPASVGIDVTVRAQGQEGILATLPWRPGKGPVLLPNLRRPADGAALEVTVEPVPGSFGAPDGYTLRVLPHAPLPEDTILEVEPNDEGTPFGLTGTGTVRGYLTGDADRDVFALEIGRAEEGATWLLDLDLRGTDDLVLGYALPSSSGGAPVTGDLNLGGAGQAELSCNVVVEPGTLTVQVWRKAAEGDAAPREEAGRYDLALNLHAEKGIEREPNEEVEVATPLVLAQDLRGYLGRTDVDVFAFDVRAEAEAPTPVKEPAKGGGLSRVIDRFIDDKKVDGAEPDAKPEGDLPQPVRVILGSEGLVVGAEVLDEDGIAVIRGKQQIAGDPLTLSGDLPPGRYYVRVKDSGTRFDSCAQHYTLRVETGAP